MKWFTQFTQSPDGLLWGAYEDGQTFIAGVLAKIPDEALRAQAKLAFDAAAAKDAVTLIGDGVLARADYSKHMDAIKLQDTELKDKLAAATALYEKNDAWYKVNTAALQEYPALKSKIEELEAGGGGEGDKGKGGGAGMTKEEIAKLVNDTLDGVLPDRERGYVDVVAFMQDTGGTHLKLFGEMPSMRELTANPKLGKPIIGQPGRVFSLQDAYNEKYGAAIAEKQKKAHDDGIEAEVQKRLQEERSKHGSDLPFPLRGTPPSVLDVLTTEKGPAAHTLDTAVTAYESLQTNRG